MDTGKLGQLPEGESPSLPPLLQTDHRVMLAFVLTYCQACLTGIGMTVFCLIQALSSDGSNMVRRPILTKGIRRWLTIV